MSTYDCKCGRPMGRYDQECSACFAAKVFGMQGSKSVRVMVFCDCHKPEANGMELPDPQCRRCGGTGEVEAEPF